MCFNYYSNTLGLTFGDTNLEVYRIDQIKEWTAMDPDWLDNVREMLEQQAGKSC